MNRLKTTMKRTSSSKQQQQSKNDPKSSTTTADNRQQGRLINRNKLYFDSQKPSEKQNQRLLSEIWDGSTLPFKPPRPCMIYHIVELAQYYSPRALNRLEAMNSKDEFFDDDENEFNNNMHTGNSNNDAMMMNMMMMDTRRNNPNGTNSRAVSEATSTISRISQSTMSSQNTSTINNKNNKKNQQNNNRNNNLGSNNNNNNTNSAVDLSTQHKRLLHQQKIFTTYYPVTRVVVPDKEGLYWELDPTKTYYFEEANSTLTTSHLLLREILPVLPRYDVFLKDAEERTKRSQNNTTATEAAETTTMGVMRVDSSVQTNIWCEGTDGKFVRNTKPELSSLVAMKNIRNGKNGENKAFDAAMAQRKLGGGGLGGGANANSLLLSGQRRARTMSSQELFRILNNPDEAHRQEQQRVARLARERAGNDLGATNNTNLDEDSFSVASVQALSFLRQRIHDKATQQQQQQLSGGGGGGTNPITMSQMMIPSSQSQQQQQQQTQQLSQRTNNNNTQASQQLSVFLSQKGHSGAAREKDELVKQSVRDAMRFLPGEVQEELQRVLESSDMSWSQ